MIYVIIVLSIVVVVLVHDAINQNEINRKLDSLLQHHKALIDKLYNKIDELQARLLK